MSDTKQTSSLAAGVPPTGLNSSPRFDSFREISGEHGKQTFPTQPFLPSLAALENRSQTAVESQSPSPPLIENPEGYSAKLITFSRGVGWPLWHSEKGFGGNSRAAGGLGIVIAECETSNSEGIFSRKMEHRRFIPRSIDFLKRDITLRQSLQLVKLDIPAIFKRPLGDGLTWLDLTVPPPIPQTT